MRWDKSKKEFIDDGRARDEFLRLTEKGYEALMERALGLYDSKDEYERFLFLHIQSYVGRKAIERRVLKAERGWTDQQVDDYWDSFNRL